MKYKYSGCIESTYGDKFHIDEVVQCNTTTGYELVGRIIKANEDTFTIMIFSGQEFEVPYGEIEYMITI